MNIQNLMRQAQKMQKEIEAKKNNLKKQEFNFEHQGVSLTMLGNYQIKKLTIDKNLIDPDDVELLEDFITLVINNAVDKISEEHEEIMPKQESL